MHEIIPSTYWKRNLASQVAVVVRNPPANVGDVRDTGSIPGLGRLPGGGNGNHSSILIWEIPWTEEPGGLQSMGLQKVGQDWVTELNSIELPTSSHRWRTFGFCYYFFSLKICQGLLYVVEWFFVCAQSCPTLCHPMDYSPPGPSVHGISQIRILEWVAISSSRGSSQPRDQTCAFRVSCESPGLQVDYLQLSPWKAMWNS